MPIGSVKGLLVTLLFVVPGALGVALRRSVFATQAPSPFTELLHSLAASLVALLLTESAFMVVGGDRRGMGDFLIGPLADQGSFPQRLRWSAYVAYVVFALAVPVVGAWLRRSRIARFLFSAISPHADGLDYVVNEARPRHLRREELWATVNTHSDEALLGQIAWRSTAPDELEVVLSRVRDMNDPTEREQQEEWVVWLPRDSIRAIWVHVPEPDNAS